MDRFDDLATFVAVAERRSVRQAAEFLERAPSAVSRRIKDLEQRLQTQLLTRTTRQINLTSAGERFYATARRLLDELEEAETTAATDTHEINGDLKIATPLSFGLAHLCTAIADFMSDHPAVIITADLNDQAVNLAENRIDVAIRIGSLPDSSLRARQLAPIHHAVAASPDFWATHGVPKKPDKLNGLPALCYSNINSPHQWSWSNARGDRGQVNLQPRYRASNGDALVEAAIRGLGVVRLPTFLLSGAVQAGSLQVVLHSTNWGVSALHALYLDTAFLPYRSRAFIDFLVKRFGNQPDWDACLGKHLKQISKAPTVTTTHW